MREFTSIQVDPEIFELLQRNATPLVDSPNDVLRRLLMASPTKPPSVVDAHASRSAGHVAAGADAFVAEVLRARFGTDLRRVSPYRMMFESQAALVYFQNFNKESDHLWYRVTENAWRDLTATRKECWLCLTNPSERFAYIIPLGDIRDRVERTNWSRPYLEINIDPASSRWTELDWRIEAYLERF